MNKKLEQRYSELEVECNEIENSKKQVAGQNSNITTIDNELFISWKVKVKNLISISCGESSQHFQAFAKGEKRGRFEKIYDVYRRLRAIFSAAKEDFCGGYLSSIKNLIQAEVFESELEQAEELLDKGYKIAAAVIAGVVIETTLRDLCDKENLRNGKLDKMNSDLVKAGVYNKLQQKRITAIADIRNSAAHGKGDDFSTKDVEVMIRDIESFLLTVLA